jgi:hypothetical protein
MFPAEVVITSPLVEVMLIVDPLSVVVVPPVNVKVVPVVNDIAKLAEKAVFPVDIDVIDVPFNANNVDAVMLIAFAL